LSNLKSGLGQGVQRSRLKNPDSPYHLDNQDTGYWMLEKGVERAV